MAARDLVPQGGLDPQYRAGYHPIDDVPIGAIVGFSAALVAFAALSAAALALVMRLAQVGEDVEQARRPALFADTTGLYAQAGPDVFKENPLRDNARELAAEAASLTTYGYADPASRQGAQIPLDRAIDILARRGLPKLPVTAAAEPTPADALRRARVNPRPTPPAGLDASPPGTNAPPAEATSPR
jgi:hypothetical protein